MIVIKEGMDSEYSYSAVRYSQLGLSMTVSIGALTAVRFVVVMVEVERGEGPHRNLAVKVPARNKHAKGKCNARRPTSRQNL
jgi:hypothetical protein